MIELLAFTLGLVFDVGGGVGEIQIRESIQSHSQYASAGGELQNGDEPESASRWPVAGWLIWALGGMASLLGLIIVSGFLSKWIPFLLRGLKKRS